MLNIIIVGINGHMGKFIYDSARKHDVNIVCGIDKNIAGAFDCPIFKSFDECDSICDVIIDFSSPNALNDILNYSLNNKTPIVIGTTAYNEKELKLIEDASKQIPIFKSSNMSIGVNVLLKLCTVASKYLYDYDIEIIDKHHNNKNDAPSGTSLQIYNTINKVFNNSKQSIFGRNGKGKRKKDEIGIHAIRGGTLVGEHSVLLLGENESLEIKHTAYSKELFAEGAITAGKFIANKTPGIYTMDDIISLNI